MSHNADAAYQQGARPLSKWTKAMFVSHDDTGAKIRESSYDNVSTYPPNESTVEK